MPDVRINAVPIANVLMDEALEMIDRAIERREKRCVFFVNADCINLSAQDSGYHGILTGRDDAWIFADGVGMRIAGRVHGVEVKDNVNGTDLFPRLCARAAGAGHRLFLLGAKPGVAEEVDRRMTARFPGLRIAGVQHGFFDPAETDSVIARINDSGADVLLVAMGAPRQERWIAQHRRSLQVPVAMGVGGLFDFYSGRVPRAPKLVRDVSMEWAWRLAMEPRRLWRRYLLGNFTFVSRVLWWELSGRNQPR